MHWKNGPDLPCMVHSSWKKSFCCIRRRKILNQPTPGNQTNPYGGRGGGGIVHKAHQGWALGALMFLFHLPHWPVKMRQVVIGYSFPQWCHPQIHYNPPHLWGRERRAMFLPRRLFEREASATVIIILNIICGIVILIRMECGNF